MPHINLFASLRKAAGIKDTTISGANLADVVLELVKQHPGLAGFLLENGQIRKQVIFTINGQLTTDLGQAVTELDQIAIFPPIAGGR